MNPFDNIQPHNVMIINQNTLVVEFLLPPGSLLWNKENVHRQLGEYMNDFPNIKQINTEWLVNGLKLIVLGNLNLSNTNPFL